LIQPTSAASLDSVAQRVRLIVNSPHTIRLRGPWEYRILEPAKNVDRHQGRIDISNLESLQSAIGRIELVRRFNKPTGLEGARVELVIGPCAHAIAVDLNDESLSVIKGSDELRYDITAQLQSRNILRIVIDIGKLQDIQLDQVRLEIHPS
jgi:hypothetical protein